MRPSKRPLPQSFLAKKKTILDQLSVPVSDYDDLSPKGSIDVDIRDLIDEINRIDGCVTTSSCSGRVSVFLEGKKRTDGEVLDDQRKEANNDFGDVRAVQDEAHVTGDENEARETTAGIGGKGGGGRWLYVSHSPVDISQHDRVGGISGLLGMGEPRGDLPHDSGSRFIHFKFEPMILHILTASFEEAQRVLSAALQAGFRESGAINLVSSTKGPPTPMVAVRSMGLALESLIGFHEGGKEVCSVSEGALKTLLAISNERFQVNSARITRFRELLMASISTQAEPKRREDGEEWEDAQERKERKRAEGLMRRGISKGTTDETIGDPEDIAGLEFFQ